MATHHFLPDRYHRAMGFYRPVLAVDAGDTIVTTTVCGDGRDATGTRITTGGNPVTGPFFVFGAAHGDTLAVTFERIRPTRRAGHGATIVGANVVDPDIVRSLPRDGEAAWDVDVEQGTCTLVDPPAAPGALVLPMEPMLGCVGVAPARQQAISTATAAAHGGNMDYRGHAEGVTALFPVFQEGALFYLGDGHARQGDGEILGSGIEISMEVQFRLDVRKGQRSHWPRIETARELMAIGNARPLDQAVQHATTELMHWLRADYGLDAHASSLLLGHAIRYDIANFYNPAYTVVARIERKWLP